MLSPRWFGVVPAPLESRYSPELVGASESREGILDQQLGGFQFCQEDVAPFLLVPSTQNLGLNTTKTFMGL